MTDAAPVTTTLARRNLHKRSGFAVALALRAGARRLPPGPIQSFLHKKALRIENCAAYQRHRLLTRAGKPSVVVSASPMSCLARECMNCEAMRANALAADMVALMGYVWRLSPGARPLMLTLTAKSRKLSDARAMLLAHQKALKAFFAYDRIVNSTLGQAGNIEATFSETAGANSIHFHSHHIVMVAAGALSDHRYIRQAEWVSLWQRALKAPYKPVVDIRAVRSRDGLSTDPDSIRGAVREVFKYCLDSGSFIQHEDGNPLVNPDVAVAFALAVHRRRLNSMTGIFCAAKKLRAQECKASPTTSVELPL